MEKEVKKLFPFDICYGCLRSNVEQSNVSHGKLSMSSISIRNSSFLFVPQCKHWSLQGKKVGKKWGPKIGCNYTLEHMMVERKKFAITSIFDLKNVRAGIDNGSCLVVFSDYEFKIYDDRSENTAKSLAWRMNRFSVSMKNKLKFY